MVQDVQQGIDDEVGGFFEKGVGVQRQLGDGFVESGLAFGVGVAGGGAPLHFLLFAEGGGGLVGELGEGEFAAVEPDEGTAAAEIEMEIIEAGHPQGLLAHGEMAVDGGENGRIMLATATPLYESPKHHREHCDRARAWSENPWIIDGVLVYVDDVDAHYAQAVAAGAVILSELEDGFPRRRYRVEDVEGHRWMFMQKAG